MAGPGAAQWLLVFGGRCPQFRAAARGSEACCIGQVQWLCVLESEEIGRAAPPARAQQTNKNQGMASGNGVTAVQGRSAFPGCRSSVYQLIVLAMDKNTSKSLACRCYEKWLDFVGCHYEDRTRPARCIDLKAEYLDCLYNRKEARPRFIALAHPSQTSPSYGTDCPSVKSAFTRAESARVGAENDRDEEGAARQGARRDTRAHGNGARRHPGSRIEGA